MFKRANNLYSRNSNKPKLWKKLNNNNKKQKLLNKEIKD